MAKSWEITQVELIQQLNDAEHPHTVFVSRNPEGVMHYAGPWARDMAEYQAQREHMQSVAHQEIQSGFIPASQVHFSYSGQPGVYPLIEIATAGQPSMAPVLQKMRDSAQNCDGTRPSIPVAELFAA